MAETALGEKSGTDVPEQETHDGTNPDNATTEPKTGEETQHAPPTDDVNEAGNSNGDVNHNDQNEVKDDEAQQDQHDDEGGDEELSRSNDRKRKHPPRSGNARDDYPDKRKRDRATDNGGWGYNKPSRKNKARFEDQPESSDADEIRRQVEFYFSDSNLPIDEYLLKATGGRENKPVPLSTIHNFKRMRHFQPFSAVRDAVAQSQYLVLNDKDEVSRKIPLSDHFTDDVEVNRKKLATDDQVRSIYAKGFGEETETMHLDIEAFFAPYGPINAVRLRRHPDGEFKGSVFVEFANEEARNQFLELDPKPQWNGKDLQIMGKDKYVAEKHDGMIEGIVKPRDSTYRSFASNRHNNDNRRGNRDRGGRGSQNNRGKRNNRDRRDHLGDGDGDGDGDEDDWKARRDRDNEKDRRNGRFRERGRSRGGRRGGNRGGRRRSPDDREGGDDGHEDGLLNRAEAEAKSERDRKAKQVDDATVGAAKGDAAAGANDVKEGNADAPAANGAKKRAREDDGEEPGDNAKKIKDDGAV